MSIYLPHFRTQLVKTLTKMQADSPQARMAITMIVAHESNGGEYWKQLGSGPALGIIQMEPPTHESTWDFADSINQRAKWAGITRDIDKLSESMEYNIFMARCRLFMKSEPFPDGAQAMSDYLKRHWNTTTGKADKNSYIKDFLKWLNP